jgi:hypothetical protein
MRGTFTFLTAFLIASSCQQVFGQLLKGIIKDASSDSTISFAHVSCQNGKGTVSNQSGQFELALIEAGNFITVSHIGYQTRKVMIDEQKNIEILLHPDIILLEEITLIDDTYARAVANEVMGVLANGESAYGKAFYRQISKHDTMYTSFSEGFYELEYSSRGVEKVNLKQARFANKKSDTIPFFRFANFDYLSIGLNVYNSNTEPNINELAKPFGRAYFDDYQFRLQKQWTKAGDSLVEVKFFPGENLRLESSLQGSFTYNRSQKRLLQQKLHIINALGADNIELTANDKSRNDQVDMMNPKYQWEISYAENTNKINHLLVRFTYDLSLNGKIFPCSIFSHFTIYEKMKKKPRGLTEAKVTDHYTFRNAEYRPRFWRDNPVVKQTPEEKSMIATFEKDNAFGSYFK